MMKLEYIHHSKPYDDISIELNSARFNADTYYVSQIFSDEKRNKDPEYSVKLLRDYWKSKIAAMDDYEVIYLPFGFEDQGSTWFKVESYPDSLFFSFGTSSVEGWRVSLENLPKLCVELDFTRVSEIIELNKSTTLSELGV